MRRAWIGSAAAVFSLLCAYLAASALPTAAQQPRPGGRHRSPNDGGSPDGALQDGGLADAATADDAAETDAGVPDAESEREREGWRVPPDLVNPFTIDDYDDDIRRNHGGAGDDHAQPVHPRSWYLVEEDLVDPWNRGAARPRTTEGSAAPIVENAAQLDTPQAHLRRISTAQERLARSQGVEADLALGAAMLGSGDARPRLDVEFVLRQGTFLLGFEFLASGGAVEGIDRADDGHTFFRRNTYGRYAALLSLGHRLTDGQLSMDVSLDLGAMASVFDQVGVLPIARVTGTGALRAARNVWLFVRVDLATSFVAPGGFVAGGPGAYELGLSLGVRLGGE